MGAEGALAQQTRAFLYAALLGLSLGLFYDILRLCGWFWGRAGC